jgi:hypothetical protein
MTNSWCETTFKLALLFIVAIILLWGCSTRYPDQQYMALHLHSRWDFGGALRWIEVADSITDHAEEYTLHFGIGTRGIVIAMVRYTEGRFSLTAVNGAPMGYPAILFDPPIPILPPSEKVGETQTWEAAEIHEGNPSQRFRVRVQTTVLEPSPVTAADTTFNDVLRIRVDYAYEDPSTMPFLAGDSEWWFARNVGIVRYQIGWYPYQDVISYGKVTN